MKTKIKTILSDILSHLDIKPESISIDQDDQNTYQINLQVSEGDTGILIGYHGDTIAALQLLLGLMLYHQQQEWSRIVLNVGDYRQKREEDLKAMAQDTAEKVLLNQEAIALFNLNPFERRIVHLYLSENKDIVTKSQGQGKNRHLIVSPASDSPSNESASS